MRAGGGVGDEGLWGFPIVTTWLVPDISFIHLIWRTPVPRSTGIASIACSTAAAESHSLISENLGGDAIGACSIDGLLIDLQRATLDLLLPRPPLDIHVYIYPSAARRPSDSASFAFIIPPASLFAKHLHVPSADSCVRLAFYLPSTDQHVHTHSYQQVSRPLSDLLCPGVAY